MEYLPRGCERCGAGSHDIDFNPNGIVHPICSEFQMIHGVVAWLCIDCRREWHHALEKHKLMQELDATTFRMEFWKTRASRAENEPNIGEGVELLSQVRDLERQLREFAQKWLVES